MPKLIRKSVFENQVAEEAAAEKKSWYDIRMMPQIKAFLPKWFRLIDSAKRYDKNGGFDWVIKNAVGKIIAEIDTVYLRIHYHDAEVHHWVLAIARELEKRNSNGIQVKIVYDG